MKLIKLLITAIFFLSTVSVFGQIEESKKPGREDIEKIMKQKLMDKLSFDESTADRFLNSYKENNRKIRQLNKEKKELMETIELDPSAQDIDSKLNQMLDIETQMLEQRRSFFSELRTYLTPQQIAKTMLLRKNFQKEFRKEIQMQRKKNKEQQFDK